MKRIIALTGVCVLALGLCAGCGHVLCHPTKAESQQNVDFRECDHIAAAAEAKGQDRDDVKDQCLLDRGYIRVSPGEECIRTHDVD